MSESESQQSTLQLTELQVKVFDCICEAKTGQTLYGISRKIHRPKDHVFSSVRFLMKIGIVKQVGAKPAHYVSTGSPIPQTMPPRQSLAEVDVVVADANTDADNEGQ